MAPFETKKKQHWKKVTSKKLVKVEEDEVDGDEKSKKIWKDCNVKALIILCGGDGAKICQECQKEKKKGKTSILTMCFNSCSFETLKAKY